MKWVFEEIGVAFFVLFMIIGIPAWILFWAFKFAEAFAEREQHQRAAVTGTFCRPAPEWGKYAEICLRRDE